MNLFLSICCLLRSNQSFASAHVGLNSIGIICHPEQFNNNSKGKKQWFSEVGQFAAVF